MSRLVIRPCSVKAATAWVKEVHRHLPRVQGALWAVQVLRDGQRVGVAMVGHPARVWTKQHVLCLLRVAVLAGQPNACSKLYGACARTAKNMGATALVTYTLQSEPGTSLKAAGWLDAGLTKGGSHSREKRPRAASPVEGPKRRWFAAWSTPPVAKGVLDDLLARCVPSA